MNSYVFSDSRVKTLFAYFGFTVFAFKSLKFLKRILNNIGTFAFGLGAVDFKAYGSWAVVTGCTDGIGKAYAEQLAKRGLNIVLISRTFEKLEQQSIELKSKYKIETIIISADFTTDSIYENIKNNLNNLDIAVLVNNVGMGLDMKVDYFHILSEMNAPFTKIINCNILSLTKMTAIVLPNMVKKKKGIIINNGSGAGRTPLPILTVYSATKAYVDFFSRALDIEYKDKGIIIQSLCPYRVPTKLSRARERFTAPNPNSFVSSALKTIRSQPVTNGCLVHNIQGWFIEEILPTSLIARGIKNSINKTK